MQSKNKNDSIQLSTRYQQYDFAKRHLRGTSRPEVFPFGESNTETQLMRGKITNASEREFKWQKRSPTLAARDYKEPKIVSIPTQLGGSKKFGNAIGSDVAYTLRASEPNGIIIKKVIGKVKVRKHIVNVERLKEVLREHKNLLNQPIKEVAKYCNVPITKAEHWFRKDKCFAIPEAEVWFELKEFLGIKTDEFDKAITEFEIRDNKFDMSNRVYQKEGISPTLTTLTGGHQMASIDDGYSIRRLTPKECERLQGFPDNWTEGVSDTQKYKCAGNAVTVNVIQAIMEKLICKKSLN